MKRNKPTLASGIFASFALALSLPSAAQITLHFNERQPYTFTKDGQLTGLIGSPAITAFKDAKIPFIVRETPFARQIAIIKANTGLDCGLNWLKNEERESYGKYTAPIYKDKKRIALSSAKNEKLKDGDSIEATLSKKNITLLVKTAYSYGKPLDAAIKKTAPTKVEVTVENLQMLQMIMAGRADLMFIPQEEAESMLAAAGLGPSDVRMINFSNAPEGEIRYVACSKQVPDEIITKFNNAIKQLQKREAPRN
ncbi:substrate-binding periplasmic protein [Niveibacterium terrae]|uniref:substrate-binding periplasmic protein n=1 Tax=Niveibacterium terrae TaxID=3373598 RepID=UPI003A910654